MVTDSLCSDLVLNIGFSLLNRYVLIVIYLLSLGYIFLGIGLISDIFMEAIEVITSQTTLIEKKDS